MPALAPTTAAAPREQVRGATTSLAQYEDGPGAISANLRLRILSGEFATGSALKIRGLADEFGVSIVPVREALRTLAAEGLVQIRPRRSPVVARPDLREILEINEIRAALEPLVLSDAVRRHDEASVAACRAILAEDRDCPDRWRKVELNRRFHLALLAPSRMERAKRVIGSQYVAIALFAQLLVVRRTAVIGEPHAEHETLLDAVARRDGRLALDRLARHLRASSERARAALARIERAAV